MKLPEIGPDIRLLASSRPETLQEIVNSAEAKELFRNANQEYWPWEDFKHKAQNLKFRPEELWCTLKLLRSSFMNTLPLTDVRGMSFRFWLPDRTQENLHHIDQSGGGRSLLEEASFLPEAKEQYMVSSLMEEAIASSQIEGAATTRRVAKEMLRKNLKPRDRSEQMIVNNYKTVLEIKERLDEPMTVDLLNHLHRMITENTLDDPATSGRVRNENEPILIVDNEGEVLHTPPPAAQLPYLIHQLCDFANLKNDTTFIHPVIRAVVLHFWLAYLHPYVDGNGRAARALFYWSMLRQKYWLFEYLSISRLFLRSRQQYQRAFLHTERDDCDVTYFIVYHVRVIRLAILELQEYLKRKQKQYREALMQLKKASWMNYRQRALIQHALKHPDFIYTIESHKNSHNVTYQTARMDLLKLAEGGYLEKLKSGRTFHFTVAPDIARKVNQAK